MSSSGKRQEILQSLVIQLRLTSANSVMHSQAVADLAGIHSTDMECIDFLLLKGPASAGQIADMAGLTTGAVTAMIDRLEGADLVKRQHDTHDRRRVLVVPNVPKIMAQVTPHFTPMQQAVMKLVDEFSDDELEIVLRFLERSNEAATLVVTQLRNAP